MSGKLGNRYAYKFRGRMSGMAPQHQRSAGPVTCGALLTALYLPQPPTLTPHPIELQVQRYIRHLPHAGRRGEFTDCDSSCI